MLITKLEIGKNRIVEVDSMLGDELDNCIDTCIRYCEKNDVRIILNFNGIKREINKGTYAKGLSDNWYNSDYVSIQDSREKKLNDLGI